MIFITCNGLNDAKETLINGNQIKALDVANFNQIEGWNKLKGKKKWVRKSGSFNDSKLEPTSSKHFPFGFVKTNLHHILNFEYSLVDDVGQLITFKEGENKVPV